MGGVAFPYVPDYPRVFKPRPPFDSPFPPWHVPAQLIRSECHMPVRHNHRVSGVATDPENRDPDDWYVTPPHATESLLRVERFYGHIWEPACGDGAMSEVLKTTGLAVISTDIVDRGYGTAPVDFLAFTESKAPNIVTNPPYKLATEFAWRAVELAKLKVALLVRLQFLESQERRKLFEYYPPARVWVFSKRLTMWRRGIATSKSGGTNAFCWVVWDSNARGKPTQLGWV